MGQNGARPWVVWSSRLAHPLPFLALLYLGFSMTWRRLSWAQGCVMGLYAIYLAPYVVASYYERYAMPLLAVKVLLVLWAADHLLCWMRGLTDYSSTRWTPAITGPALRLPGSQVGRPENRRPPAQPPPS
jgi:hypothetical protein